MLTTGYTVAQINKSHESYAKATLIKGGVEQTTELEVIAGGVSVDATAAIRRRAKIRLRGYRPEVDPFTCEIKLYRSVESEYVALGVFRIEDPTFTIGPEGPLTELEAYDRAYWVSSLRLPAPYAIADQTPVADAIRSLLASRAPGLTFSFTASSFKVPAVVFEEGSDPWEKGLTMAESAGLELFFDTDGVCVLRPIATGDNSSVVATYGSEARILSAQRKQSTKDTYSHAIVTGENTNVASPIRAEAMDTDPASPTYYLGIFGDRPTWLRSQFITTQDQATAAAKALLARSKGRSEVVSLEGIPNPAHDAGDVIRVTKADIGTDAIYILDTFEIPLGVEDSMKLTTRSRRVV